MRILVERNSFPVRSLPNGEAAVAEGQTLRSFLRSRGAPEEDDAYLLAFVNGKRVTLDHVLRDGDRLELYPFSVGG